MSDNTHAFFVNGRYYLNPEHKALVELDWLIQYRDGWAPVHVEHVGRIITRPEMYLKPINQHKLFKPLSTSAKFYPSR